MSAHVHSLEFKPLPPLDPFPLRFKWGVVCLASGGVMNRHIKCCQPSALLRVYSNKKQTHLPAQPSVGLVLSQVARATCQHSCFQVRCVIPPTTARVQVPLKHDATAPLLTTGIQNEVEGNTILPLRPCSVHTDWPTHLAN